MFIVYNYAAKTTCGIMVVCDKYLHTNIHVHILYIVYDIVGKVLKQAIKEDVYTTRAVTIKHKLVFVCVYIVSVCVYLYVYVCVCVYLCVYICVYICEKIIGIGNEIPVLKCVLSSPCTLCI